MRIQNFIDSKSGLQFKVGPVVQRITESIRYRFGPLLKLFPICSILTGTETFVHTIGTHRTPLVVVTSQPNLSQRLKLVIFCHHLGNQVTVIVDNRHLRRMLVVQPLCCFCLQQEVPVHKVLHLLVF